MEEEEEAESEEEEIEVDEAVLPRDEGDAPFHFSSRKASTQ